MIGAPFNFQALRRPPPRSFDILFAVNAALILLLFTVLGSRFILAPGEPVALPVSPAANASAAAGTVVARLLQDDRIVFEGGLFSLSGIKPRLEAAAGKGGGGAVLLLQADGGVSAQALVAFCEAARAAGFVQVQIAAEQAPAPSMEELP